MFGWSEYAFMHPGDYIICPRPTHMDVWALPIW
jgi:hypothetical protein